MPVDEKNPVVILLDDIKKYKKFVKDLDKLIQTKKHFYATELKKAVDILKMTSEIDKLEELDKEEK